MCAIMWRNFFTRSLRVGGKNKPPPTSLDFHDNENLVTGGLFYFICMLYSNCVKQLISNMIKNILKYIIDNRLGAITVALSLTFMFLGLPSQIVRIWQTHSVKEISVTMFSLLTLQSVFWVLYGRQKNDWFVIIANSFGTLFSAIIVIEYFLFK